MAERVFLDDEGVTVTQERFVVSGQTYFIRSIGSVTTRIEDRNRTVPNAAMMIGALLLLYTFLVSASNGFSRVIVALGVIGIAILAWAWTWALKKRGVPFIVLHFTSGAEEAIRGEDSDRVDQVVRALNQAIAADRGQG